MEIKEYKDYKESEIRQLYTEVGWTAYTENMWKRLFFLSKNNTGT